MPSGFFVVRKLSLMPKKKIRVGIILGGKTSEHEVSLQSAKSVIEALDKTKYEPVLIGIDKQGKWHFQRTAQYLLHENDAKKIRLMKGQSEVLVAPAHVQQLIAGNESAIPHIDVVFPVLHGPLGEDGTIQGLLKLLDLPFVGPDVLGSAVGMDKDVMKRLARDAGIPITKFLVFQHGKSVSFEKAKKELGLPFFVKPANAGSSVGVSKISKKAEYVAALKAAFRYDSKIILERMVSGLEIECAVLGNEHPKASVVGAVIPQHDFYSYQAKYIDEHGARLEIPANISKTQSRKAQALALEIFKVLCLEGMARVDMFMTSSGKIIFNEVNTIPGFTSISMYPKLWVASGLPYAKLLDTLITLAIQRHVRQNKLKTAI